MVNRLYQILFAFLFVGFLSLCSCYSDNVADSPTIPLRFSVDTLRFDTVFTQVGSATRSFKIYNDLEEAVIINDLQLDNPTTSFFRLNADGFSANTVENLRIEPLDSIYIFAEVTIDPDMPLSVSPFIIEEYVNITANQSNYKVLLEAFGQNANYVPSRSSNGDVNLYTCEMGTWEWTDPRPYVIYGALFIDSCRLVIPEGQNVYVHGGIAINDLGIYNDGLLIFLQHGSLSANGTLDNPITFQTDRLEEEFSEVSGQWAGIVFSQGSVFNSIEHTTIKNSIIGISIDSSAQISIKSSTIAHTSGSGITASNATIYCENSLIYDNGSYGISLNFGGEYDFNYCTVANYDNQDQALFMNNLKCYDADCFENKVLRLRSQFTNCILVGNDDDEIALFDATNGEQPELFDYKLENSIVIVDELIDADNYPFFFENCINCENIERRDTLFVDLDNYDLHLDTLSVAIDKAKPIPILLDKDGNARESDFPDIGCFEYQK